MRLSILMILCICTVGILVGCNADPRSRRESALLRSEIMDLEDQYYSMKSRYERAIKELSECRGVPVDSLDTFSGNLITSPTAVYSEPCYDCDESIPNSTQPNSILNVPAEAPVENQTAPAELIEELPAGNPVSKRATGNRSQQEYLPDDPAEIEISYGSDAARLPKGPITEIFINPELTFAKNVDGRTGDDGLALLIQPRTSSGQTVMLSGLVTINLMDPTASTDERQVGLWKFTAGEMDLFAIQDNSQRKGYLLHLPWDINVPRSKKLLVSVRFMTVDGRRLETSKEIRIIPPQRDYSPDDPLIAEWTERAPYEQLIADGLPSGPNDGKPIRRGVRAIPAKTRIINRPEWRPVR